MLLWAAPVLLTLGGCHTADIASVPVLEPPTLLAYWTSERVTMDGQLQESVWAHAQAYPLSFPSLTVQTPGRRLKLVLCGWRGTLSASMSHLNFKIQM
ncbi:MAG TPA: hypothetical protein DEA90_01730 [Opitutae bacterium]|nr:hypothetical protein [Puniceicoccaceae bacterium]HBR92866.1 hypothetical protein [Opitutae bacterium]